MANLTGVRQALSFIGLGLVLVGIGYLYQRLLFPRRLPAAPLARGTCKGSGPVGFATAKRHSSGIKVRDRRSPAGAAALSNAARSLNDHILGRRRW
jgi:hypothetical protein